jgi:hypothetical protein
MFFKLNLNSYFPFVLVRGVAILVIACASSIGFASDKFAAIAVDVDTYNKGVVNDATTPEEAEAFALRNCGNKEKCKIVASGVNQELRVDFCGVGEDFEIVNLSVACDIFRVSGNVILRDASKGKVRPNCLSNEGVKETPDYSDSDYAVIAWNEATGAFGESVGLKDQFEAEMQAINDCALKSQNKDGCRILVYALGQCVGVRIGVPETRHGGSYRDYMVTIDENLGLVYSTWLGMNARAERIVCPKINGLDKARKKYRMGC